MSRQILSIDIRNSSLAAVVLNTGLTNNTIEAFAQEPLLPTENEDQTPLQGALERLLAQLNTPSGTGVVVGVPSDRIFYRKLAIPFKEDKKIRQVLPFELEPSLPVPVDNLIIDYQQNTDDTNGQLLTVAMDRNQLDVVMADLTVANLRPQLVVPGDFPLAQCLTTFAEPPVEQALLIVIGASRATLFAIMANQTALVRSMSADIATETGVEALALNIRQTLTAFADSKPKGFTPEVAYLSGPVFNDRKAQKRLESSLEIPTRILDLNEIAPKLDMAPGLDQWQPNMYSGALAMALIEAEGRDCPNFHRSSSILRNLWNSYSIYIKGPAILLTAVIVLSLGGVLIDSHMLKKRVDRINGQMEEIFKSAFPNAPRVGDALSQMKSELKKARGKGIDAGGSGPDVRIIDVMYYISKDIPKEMEVVFTRLVTDNDGITISGEAGAFNVVDDIKKRLESNELFKQVTIAQANMDKSGKRVMFKLKIGL